MIEYRYKIERITKCDKCGKKKRKEINIESFDDLAELTGKYSGVEFLPWQIETYAEDNPFQSYFISDSEKALKGILCEDCYNEIFPYLSKKGGR